MSRHPKQPPLTAEAKQALRDVLEPEHPQDRDLLALLDEVERLQEHLAIARKERDEVLGDFRGLTLALAVVIVRGGGVLEITGAELEAVENGRVSRLNLNDDGFSFMFHPKR